MADKPPTLEGIARAEAAENARREALKKAYLEGQKRLAKEMPSRFFTMAAQIRDGVGRFNGAAKLERLLTYHESAAVTTRDANPAGDFLVEVRREPNWVRVALRSLWRLHLPDAALIEGEGQVGVPPNARAFRLRVDGVMKGSELLWRITSGGQLVDTPLDEIGERLIAVVATGELSRLWRTAPFVDLSR